MDKIDKVIKKIFRKTEREFSFEEDYILPIIRKPILYFIPRRYLAIVASFLILVLSIWIFSIPQLLYEGVGHSLELYGRTVSSIYEQLGSS